MIEVPEHIRTRYIDEMVADLSTVTRDLLGWTGSLPGESLFYLNLSVVVPHRPFAPKGFKPIDLICADVFLDTHSFLAAQVLLKGWRAGQLAEGLVYALENWNITVAASVARTLVETAAACTVEFAAVTEAWANAKTCRIRTKEDAMRIRNDLLQVSAQLGWGTRIADIVQKFPSIQRTNVLTLIDKAAKKHDASNLRAQYEQLCDAVHPSLGASECFWKAAGKSDSLPQFRVLVSRNASGPPDEKLADQASQLPAAILNSSTWSLRVLYSVLESFSVTCRDICLTSNVYIFENVRYWGLVAPTKPYELCPCGAGNKSRFCRHVFGQP